ncbi:hypothetical protein GLW08_11095 [Pontibacillus yanchengensis]|uniref:Uncharacterized protein n=1 Tax=Pontibacillus yanchengensis TaxID=462910 RepID=A0ACC7VGG7_9BACI|nr:DUF5316 family protein [Pontibacillus yanchengensis]MYL53882.1 hypothetical protein [Pontibacillus yanchengensis]
MLKYLGIGSVITLVGLIHGFYTKDWEMALTIIGVGGVGPLLGVALLTGIFVSGDQYRFNKKVEMEEDKEKKDSWITRLLMISAPNIGLLIVLFVVSYVAG